MSKYKAEYAKQAEKLCDQFGAIDRDLAEFFGVCIRTIHSWKVQHPGFRNALKLGKEAPNERVKQALYHRAVGYTFIETKLFQYQGEVIREEVETHIPPDVKAQMYWLSNRCRDEWSFRPDPAAGDDDEAPDAVEVEVVDGRKG